MPTLRDSATSSTTSTISSKASITSIEITDLMGQHQAIRTHIKFIAESFAGTATPSGQATARPPVTVSDLKRLCLWPLYDFQEGLQCHIARDEFLLTTLASDVPIEDLRREHEAIKKLVDAATRLAENAVYNQLSTEELNHSALRIGEIYHRIYELIDVHTDEEEKRLRSLRTNPANGHGYPVNDLSEPKAARTFPVPLR